MKKLLFITGISLLTCCMAAGQKEATRVRNIVLVHGASGQMALDGKTSTTFSLRTVTT